MENIVKRFVKAVEKVESKNAKIAYDDSVKLYGLFKQATIGDNTTPRPWFFQFDACAKWDSWTKQKGKPQERAMSDYIGIHFKIVSGSAN